MFAYYAYDDPIPVEGNIHVGLVQGSEAMLNFGLDKNTNANAGQLHYQLGLGGAWLNSEIEGTVMIRPVMRADLLDSWVGICRGCSVSNPACVPQSSVTWNGASGSKCRDLLAFV